jgi:hypothetical protein
MESVTLSGTTIRGSVKGRTINCALRTSPAGLKLPPGTYLLKPAENNPVYGLVMAIETAGPTGPVAPSYSKMPAGSPAAVATLVPPGAASAHFKDTPAAGAMAGSPIMHKVQPGGPAGHKVTPAAHKVAALAHKDAPAGKVAAPASPRDPAANLGQQQRVLISGQAIGENCFVAMAGFADLMAAVNSAGGVTLVVT